jgi:hypothetical protein
VVLQAQKDRRSNSTKVEETFIVLRQLGIRDSEPCLFTVRLFHSVLRSTFPAMDTQDAPDSTPQPRTRLLYSRQEAAYRLSLSVRSLDYYIATKRLATRRMGRRSWCPTES